MCPDAQELAIRPCELSSLYDFVKNLIPFYVTHRIPHLATSRLKMPANV